jgi:hypothetical protein
MQFTANLAIEIENWYSRKTKLFFRKVPGLTFPFVHVGIWDETRNETYEGHFLNKKDLFEPFIFHRTPGIDRNNICTFLSREIIIPIPVNLERLCAFAKSRKPQVYGPVNNCQANILHSRSLQGVLAIIIVTILLGFVSTTFAFLMGLFGLKTFLTNSKFDWMPFFYAFQLNGHIHYDHVNLHICDYCKTGISQTFLYKNKKYCSNCHPHIKNHSIEYKKNLIHNSRKTILKQITLAFKSLSLRMLLNFEMPRLWLAESGNNINDDWETCFKRGGKGKCTPSLMCNYCKTVIENEIDINHGSSNHRCDIYCEQYVAGDELKYTVENYLMDIKICKSCNKEMIFLYPQYFENNKKKY